MTDRRQGRATGYPVESARVATPRALPGDQGENVPFPFVSQAHRTPAYRAGCFLCGLVCGAALVLGVLGLSAIVWRAVVVG